ncbi:MAG: DUF6261 family protein [Cyclobacteriaceae bacterium]
MIKKLRTSYLLPAELTETISKYLKAIVDVSLENPFIALLINLLETDNERLNQAITAVRINRLIEDVSEADALRDDLFVGFRDMLYAFKRRKDESISTAFDAVWPILEKAGTRLHALGYTEQSGKMEALFQELDKQENQDALATLGLSDLYAELKTSQEDFAAIYNNRLDEDAKKSYPTMKDAKRKAVPHVNILIDALSILDETDPEAHQELVTKMNVITTEITSTALSRKSKGEQEVIDEEEF